MSANPEQKEYKHQKNNKNIGWSTANQNQQPDGGAGANPRERAGFLANKTVAEVEETCIKPDKLSSDIGRLAVQKPHSQNFILSFVSKYSENIGGAISMAGSSLFVFGGDVADAAVTGSFLAAEVTLTKWGHTRLGYSIGAGFFALGDGLATMANATHDNNLLQTSLAAMAGVWTVSALRAPLAYLGEHLNSPNLVRVANALQPITGLSNLTLRVPGISTACMGGNHLAAAAVTCWAISDVLVGRLQNAAKMVGSWIFRRNKASTLQEALRPASRVQGQQPEAPST